jgi:hypothetical protein
MPPLKADIASAIGKSGTAGITSQELWQEFLAQRGAAVSCVKSHINQINDLLVETDLEIFCEGRGKNARWVVRSNATSLS